ncbi:MAG: hypothetical protein R3B68_15360 [Phycisphaerales bacterium]
MSPTWTSGAAQAADGSTVWVSTSRVPLHDTRQVVGLLGTYVDITPQREARDSRLARAIEMAESASRSRASSWPT